MHLKHCLAFLGQRPLARQSSSPARSASAKTNASFKQTASVGPFVGMLLSEAQRASMVVPMRGGIEPPTLSTRRAESRVRPPAAAAWSQRA